MLFYIAVFHYFGTIHAGYRLHQVVFTQILIEIHYLFNWSVKTGEQTVADTENGNTCFWFIVVKVFLETFNRIHFKSMPAGLGDISRLVIIHHGNYCTDFQELHLFQ